MSWRLVTKRLFEHGPQTTAQVAQLMNTDYMAVDRWLREAVAYEAIERVRTGRYRIALMGIAMCENRVALLARRPGGYAWHATWMQPLPRFAEAAA